MSIKNIQSLKHFHLPSLIISSKGKRRQNLNTQKRGPSNNNNNNSNNANNNNNKNKIQLMPLYDPAEFM